MIRATYQYLVDPFSPAPMQPMWPEWPGVPGWRVPPEPAVDEGQRHWGHAGPHLHCQWGGFRTGMGDWTGCISLICDCSLVKKIKNICKFSMSACNSADYRERAEAGRGWYPCVREEQEGVHWADGQVAYREGSGPADGESRPRFLWGTALNIWASLERAMSTIFFFVAHRFFTLINTNDAVWLRHCIRRWPTLHLTCGIFSTRWWCFWASDWCHSTFQL